MIFFAKIGIFCKLIAGPLPSVVQAYTQPYYFGGRLKLIICQIRHELSVTTHEISTSLKKKTLDGGPYTKQAEKVLNFIVFFSLCMISEILIRVNSFLLMRFTATQI